MSHYVGSPDNSLKCGRFPDIVIPGKTGYLTEPADPSSIAVAIETVIANPFEAKSLAENGKKYLRDLLNAKKTSQDVYDFYRLIKERFDSYT